MMPQMQFITPTETIEVKGDTPFSCLFKEHDNQTFLAKAAVIKGVTWTIVVDRSERARLRIHFVYEEVQNQNWDLEAQISVIIPTQSHKDDLVFHLERSYDWNGYRFKSLRLSPEDLNEMAHFSWTEEPFAVYFKVQIICDKIMWFPRRNSVLKRLSNSNLLLIVENKRIYVNIEELARHSWYFEQILKRKDELEIDGRSRLPAVTLNEVNSDDFILLLKLVATGGGDIAASIVEELLKLADSFQFEGILKQIESFLLNDKVHFFGLCKKFELAFTYRMPELQNSISSVMKHYPLHDKFYMKMSYSAKKHLEAMIVQNGRFRRA